MNADPTSQARFVLFTQSCCLSCELMRVFLEAREIAFEERDISVDQEARRVMREQHHSDETPTLVIVSGEAKEVVIGFDPVRLDLLLDPAPSSDSVTGS
jgi:glutaredoxin